MTSVSRNQRRSEPRRKSISVLNNLHYSLIQLKKTYRAQIPDRRVDMHMGTVPPGLLSPRVSRETPVLEGARALSLVAEMLTSSPMLRPMSTVATSRKKPAVTGHRTLGSLLTTQSILVTLCLRPFRTTGLYLSDLYDIPTVPLVFTNTMMYSCRTYRREYFTAL